MRLKLSFLSAGLVASLVAIPAFSQVAQTVPTVLAINPVTSANSEAKPVRVLLLPDSETVLLAQMVGRITALNASLGSRVTKGQSVVLMDCSESTARLSMSEAELSSARETYESKLRLKGMDAAGETDVAVAAAAVDRAKGQIEMTKAQIQNCTIRAPFSGSVSKLHVKPFQGVNTGTPLFEIVGDGAPRLRLNAPSRWMKTLKIGKVFQIDIDETGKSYGARVTAINTRVDPVAQTIEVEGRVTGSFAGLLPGMSGNAKFSAVE